MKTRNTDNFTSMNDIVLMALEDLRKQISQEWYYCGL